MNDKIVLGQYYNSNSIIHKLDPRIKVLSLILMMVVTFLIPLNDFYLMAIIGGFILLVIILTKVPIILYIKSLKQIFFLLIFTFIFQLFTKTDGKILLNMQLSFSYINIFIVLVVIILFILLRKFIPFKLIIFIGLLVGFIYIFQFSFGVNPFFETNLILYEEGLISGTFIILRVLMIILVSTTLTLTTKPMDLANALEWYLKPFELIKLKPSILAMMISIALRFIPTLFNETEKILKAQASRGVDFKEGKLHEQIKQIVSLLIPMFVISFKRAIDLADAMEARGYIPGEKRTKLQELKFKFKDFITFVILGIILTLTIIWRINYAI